MEPLGRTFDLVMKLRDGNEEARNALIGHTCQRLRRLTGKMMKNYPFLSSVEEPDDVLQNALIRLDRALRSVFPESVRHFLNLASLQIERELQDLARQYRGRYSQRPRELTGQEGNDEQSGPLQSMPDSTGEPSSLAEWTEFHQQADRLPDDEKEVFRLLWYFGMEQQEAADVLGISLRTLKRRWYRVRCFLAEKFAGQRADDAPRSDFNAEGSAP